MKSLAGFIGLLILLSLTSCSHFPENRRDEKPRYAPRSTMFFTCIRDLNRDGIKQSLLKELCTATYGGIE
jgi:hypothetical protein